MKSLHPTSQFKKDFKKIQNDPDKVKDFKEVANYLINEQKLPEKYKQHALKGNFVGFLECHIQNDCLLIWLDNEDDVIDLIRIGSHSELFK